MLNKLFVLLTAGLMAGQVFAANKQDFESWTLDCQAELCNISQLIMKRDGDMADVIAGISFIQLSEFAVLRLRLAPGIEAKKGVGIKIDQFKALHLPLTGCDERTCELNVKVDAQLLSQMRQGRVMSVAYIHDQQQQSLPVVLHGFDQAYLQLNND
ncbi:invasion associated locus B family protein [Aliagarivorans taiwanensis]|uniref:invasion associated locus B family protein n=1 Tax=Aliagarivorans taiwanensis TaxID=561966 RepID=UPI0003FDCFF8|nr:invasion associated locus B family protein [Aliagarivorans taiwanensis]